MLVVAAFWPKKPKPPASPAAPINISLSNIGNPINAQDNRQDIKTIVPPPSPTTPQPKPKPNIHFIEPRSCMCHKGIPAGNILYESPPGLGDFDVSVVCFRNDSIPGQSLPEPSIKAHIIYKDKNGNEITDAPRGVWLGLPGESTVFESGQKKCLVIFLLSSQGTLKRLWNESYTTRNSWMSGGPHFRIRDEGIPEEVASVEINLLSHSSCLLRASFEVKRPEVDKLPTLGLSSISEG